MSASHHDAMASDQAADKADSAVCAAVLRTSLVWWGWMSLCGLTLAGLCLVQGAWVWLGLAWPLWLAGTWLTMRLWLDAALFKGLSQAAGPVNTGPLLDGALSRVLGVQPRLAADGTPRTLAVRVAGAMRLLRMLVAVCVVHGCLLLAAVLQRVFNG
ncbi:hypothetical protein [Aquabacterium sp. NJ1]|uniref:hypothetical protein n=1 Tax=Aquabacterium sp. NJ1 TaxID=1538295 RepID=UPI001269EDC4|nr:hypothetical protein [Aquabacterium sp. NJ1]